MSSSTYSRNQLMDQAIRSTSLTDWGELSFLEPLDIYLQSVKVSSKLSPTGERIIYGNVQRLLENRLRLRNQAVQYGEQIELPPDPVFILGMPRTGSTLLHQLLGCDPKARSLKYFEGLYPVRLSNNSEPDQRVPIATQQLMSLNKAAPSLARIHAGYPEAPEECSRILEHMFADSVLSFRSWVPEYSAWLAAHESEPKYYQEFQNILGLLGMDDNHQHWICKAPRHMLALASLIEVFPNCRVIWTHRDPTQVVPSLCSLATTTLALTSEHPAPKELGAGLLHRIASGLEKAIKFRTSDQQDRYVDVHYRDLML